MSIAVIIKAVIHNSNINLNAQYFISAARDYGWSSLSPIAHSHCLLSPVHFDTVI